MVDAMAKEEDEDKRRASFPRALTFGLPASLWIPAMSASEPGCEHRLGLDRIGFVPQNAAAIHLIRLRAAPSRRQLQS